MRRSRSMRATWAAPGQARWGTTSALTAMLRVSMRPWLFSMVRAAARSGGGALGASSVREGGKIAEALGDVSFQRGLVVFHHEHIVALSVRDRLTNFPLAEDRVAGNDRALQRQL